MMVVEQVGPGNPAGWAQDQCCCVYAGISVSHHERPLRDTVLHRTRWALGYYLHPA